MPKTYHVWLPVKISNIRDFLYPNLALSTFGERGLSTRLARKACHVIVTQRLQEVYRSHRLYKTKQYIKNNFKNYF